MTEFTTTLVNKDVSAARDALIKALAAQNVPDLANFTVDVAAMNKSASDVLLSAPVLSYLGEQRAVA